MFEHACSGRYYNKRCTLLWSCVNWFPTRMVWKTLSCEFNVNRINKRTTKKVRPKQMRVRKWKNCPIMLRSQNVDWLDTWWNVSATSRIIIILLISFHTKMCSYIHPSPKQYPQSVFGLHGSSIGRQGSIETPLVPRELPRGSRGSLFIWVSSQKWWCFLNLEAKYKGYQGIFPKQYLWSNY